MARVYRFQGSPWERPGASFRDGARLYQTTTIIQALETRQLNPENAM